MFVKYTVVKEQQKHIGKKTEVTANRRKKERE